MTFEFSTAQRILFGAGQRHTLAGLASGIGQRVCLVTGATPERAQDLRDALEAHGMTVQNLAIQGEPDTAQIAAAVETARSFQPDGVIGYGGGSALDAAKAIAALLTNPGDLFDYLEVIGKAQPLRQWPLPCIAVPTTAGTGSEVTRNAVIKSTEHRVKVSIRHQGMLPRAAVIDPELTLGLPPAMTASAGLDAFTQVIEPYVSQRANPLTDSFCRDGIRLAARSLRQAYHHPDDLAAREAMCMVSLYGGLALAHAGLGAVHGFAGPIGGAFDAPHGLVCACLLADVMQANIRWLQTHANETPALQRYEDIARIVTGQTTACAEDGVAWIRQLTSELQVPSLANMGLREEDFPDLVASTVCSNGIKTNPAPLDKEALQAILAAAL